jgi:uncharacterized protein DUF4339
VSAWYFNKNLKPQGPLSFEEMKKKIMRGEIGPGDLICREADESRWQMAVEWKEFSKELFPAFQKNYFKSANAEEKEWILLLFNNENPEGIQQGPYSVLQVQEMLRSAQVSLEDYVWRSGLSGWVHIKDRAEFAIAPTSLDL